MDVNQFIYQAILQTMISDSLNHLDRIPAPAFCTFYYYAFFSGIVVIITSLFVNEWPIQRENDENFKNE